MQISSIIKRNSCIVIWLRECVRSRCSRKLQHGLIIYLDATLAMLAYHTHVYSFEVWPMKLWSWCRLWYKKIWCVSVGNTLLAVDLVFVSQYAITLIVSSRFTFRSASNLKGCERISHWFGFTLDWEELWPVLSTRAQNSMLSVYGGRRYRHILI